MDDKIHALHNESHLSKLWRILIIRPIFAWQDWRCARAKNYLLRHDESYRSSYAGIEIVKRRQALYDAGVDPMDPKIPDRFTLEAEMPPISWPLKRLS